MLSAAPKRSADAYGGHDWTLNGESGWAHGFYCSQGRRPYMEDMFQYKLFNISDFSFFGIYDGHAGCRAAQWLCDHLAPRLESALAVAATGEGLEAALRRTFLEVDTEFLREAVVGRWPDGSCAICVMARGRELVVANVGDSRAVLCRLGQAVPLSSDHKPGVPRERERIIAAGGTVELVGVQRVNGVLATSRTFGDGAFKIKNLISAEPDVLIKDISPGDEFVILASDGVWDVLSNQDACDVASRAATPKEAARLLVEEALARGTNDNVTAAVVDLRAATGTISPGTRLGTGGGKSPSAADGLSRAAAASLPFSPQLLVTASRRPSYSGWLSKQQSKKNLFGSQSWQRRWYSLVRVDQSADYDASVHQEWSTPYIVLCYHGSQADAAKGSIQPRKPQVLHPDYAARREPSHDSDKLRFFSVQEVSTSRVLLLAGGSEGECTAWIGAINAALSPLSQSQ